MGARNTLIYEPSQLQFTRIYDSAMKLATDILPVKQFCIQGKAYQWGNIFSTFNAL